MRTFGTICDVIDNAIELHRLAAIMYDRLDKHCDNPRTRLLLEYLANHERTMEQLITKHKEGAGTGVLNTYIQFTLESPPGQVLDDLLAGREPPSIRDVSEIGEAVDSYLVELFHEASQEMDSTKAAEVLKELKDLEALENRKLTRNIESLEDM